MVPKLLHSEHLSRWVNVQKRNHGNQEVLRLRRI